MELANIKYHNDLHEPHASRSKLLNFKKSKIGKE